jgi:hypothetical protein
MKMQAFFASEAKDFPWTWYTQYRHKGKSVRITDKEVKRTYGETNGAQPG